MNNILIKHHNINIRIMHEERIRNGIEEHYVIMFMILIHDLRIYFKCNCENINFVYCPEGAPTEKIHKWFEKKCFKKLSVELFPGTY